MEDGSYGIANITLKAMCIIMSTVSILTCSLLIHGICNIKYKLILLTLVWIPVAFTIDLFIFIIMEIFVFKDGVMMWEVLAYLLSLVVDLIFWLAVVSLWREVKEQVGAPKKLRSGSSTRLDPIQLEKI